MRWTPVAAALLLAPVLSGCLFDVYDEDADVKIAFSYKATDLISDKDPRRLAEWIEANTDLTATIYKVDDSGAALEALRFGHADIALVDGTAGWLGWTRYDLQAIAADQKEDGRTHYQAAAWVRADSPIRTLDDLKGADSCHTGLLKSAGMFMPLGRLILDGHIDISAYPNDITAVEQIAHDHFGSPTIGGAYSGYHGALRCLSEGVGDVAFVRDTTPEDYCGQGAKAWCLPLDGYRKLADLGPVPAHPVMVSPHMPDEHREAVLDALLALNGSDKGKSILKEVLETPGITAVETEEHLGDFGDLIAVLPGMDAFNKKKYGV